MTAKIKIWFLLVSVFCLVFGGLVWIFSLLLVIFVTLSFSGAIVVVILTMGVLSALMVGLALRIFKSISVNARKRSIMVTYFGSYDRIFIIDDVKGYRTYSFWTKYGTYEKTLIETKSGKQISITDGTVENYHEMRDLIASIFTEDATLEANEWPTIFWAMIIFIASVIVVSGITKLAE